MKCKCDEVPDVFVIDKLVQLRVKRPGETGQEEALRFFTFEATRDEVIEAGKKALQDRTHPEFVDWRRFSGAGRARLTERLRAAIEGECDGLAITDDHAKAILEYVLDTAGDTVPDEVAA